MTQLPSLKSPFSCLVGQSCQIPFSDNLWVLVVMGKESVSLFNKTNCQFICLSISQFMYLTTYLSTCPSIHPSSLSIHHFIYLSTYLSINLSLYSVQFSRLDIYDSLWPHGLQHARPPRPSPTPGACSNSCPSSQLFHPTISSFVVTFSSCLQSFPASGSFPMNQFFTSGTEVVVLQLQHQSFQWTLRTDLL